MNCPQQALLPAQSEVIHAHAITCFNPQNSALETETLYAVHELCATLLVQHGQQPSLHMGEAQATFKNPFRHLACLRRPPAPRRFPLRAPSRLLILHGRLWPRARLSMVILNPL
ncbi:MAG: hypothetical protein GX600_09915 [Dehalococcoidia bacterium]|nr:hypothetical protein [Dehalococcoidia bacterium]